MFEGGRIWLVIGGILGVVVIVLGWFGGASPLFDQAAAADAQRVDVETLNAAQEAKLAELQALDEDEILARYAQLEESVPLTIDLEGYFDWVAVAAGEAAVSLSSVSVTDAQPYSKAEGSLGTIALSPELTGSLGVVGVSMSISSGQEQMQRFVEILQTDGRLQLLDNVGFTFGTSLTGTIEGYIFVIDDPALAAIVAAANADSDGSGDSATDGAAEGETDAGTDGEEAEETDAPADPSSTPTPAARG